MPLSAGFFTDELQKKGPRNPCLEYDLRGNVLLIQRLYICTNEGMKHKHFSGSLSILENIPKLYGLGCFPIVMFHKSSCTKQLLDFVETQILQGINFLAMCEGIAEERKKEERKKKLGRKPSKTGNLYFTFKFCSCLDLFSAPIGLRTYSS